MPPKKKASSQSSLLKVYVVSQSLSARMRPSSAQVPARNGYTTTALASVNVATKLRVQHPIFLFWLLPRMPAGAYNQTNQHTVEDLRLEIARLKESLLVAQAEAKAKSDPPQRSYVSVMDEGENAYNGRRNGQHKPGRKRQRGCPGENRETQTSSEESAIAATSVKEKGENKIRVIGTRRVWGTLKSSNVKSVKSVIARVWKIREVRVVRKDRVKPGTNKSMWWYVVHAKESVLSDLETCTNRLET